MSISKILSKNLEDTSDTKLLLHCNGSDGSLIFTDASPSEHGNATVFGSSQVDTAEKKFGTGSLLLDGVGDYITFPDSSDWNIAGDSVNDATIAFWYKPAETPQNNMFFLCHFENLNNYWSVAEISAVSGIKFEIYSNGSDWHYAHSGVHLTDTNWHYIAICKVANEYGVYLDGVQIAYLQTAFTDTYTGNLCIGGIPSYNFVDGWMDEIILARTNILNASPNSGKTDIISVPTSEFEVLEISKILSKNLEDVSKILSVTK